MVLGSNHPNQLGIFNLHFKIFFMYFDFDLFLKIHFRRLEENGNKTKKLKFITEYWPIIFSDLQTKLFKAYNCIGIGTVRMGAHWESTILLN